MTIEVDFGEVMHHFYAGRQYGVVGPNYEDINWFEDEPLPSKDEMLVLWEQIKDQVATKKINDSRSVPGNYPSKDDLIIALWEMVVEDRPEYAQELQQRRLEIKAQFPK